MEADSEKRNSLVSSGDRSAKIRTYNYPQGRVTDHRINLTLHKLDEFLSGESIRNAMYKNENWAPEELKGVCLPSTWKNDDHRGLMEVPIYMVKVNGPTDKKSVDQLMKEKIIQLVKEDQISLPRRPEWRGY